MSVHPIRDEGQTLQVPQGKILGIVESQSDLDSLAKSLASAGFKAKTLGGEEGVALIERIDQFFFSDMEERVLNRHIEELKAGHFIVSIEAASDRRDEAVSIAGQNGARRLVHFGHLAVTWLTK